MLRPGELKRNCLHNDGIDICNVTAFISEELYRTVKNISSLFKRKYRTEQSGL